MAERGMSMDAQKSHYNYTYSNEDSDFGMPDFKIIDGMPVNQKKILSIGSGTGNDIWYLAPKNMVIGLDYSINGSKVAIDHGMFGILGDLSNQPTLPFKNEEFDIVICKDILEHILDPLSLLLEVKRVLKNDGYAVISLPNHFYLFSRLRILFGKGLIWNSLLSNHRKHFDEWNYMHIRFFTFGGVKRLIQTSGFSVDKWFWDFGTLAHYEDPDRWALPQLWKKAHNKPMSRKGRLGLSVFYPLWKIFNFIFPKKIRGLIVSLAPGLLCAGFYFRIRKNLKDVRKNV